MTLAEKLHPSRFTAMSGQMAAIVAHLLVADGPRPPSPNWWSRPMATSLLDMRVTAATTTISDPSNN